MEHIIIAFQNEQTAQKTKSALTGQGGVVLCKSVAEALRNAALLQRGIIITGFKLSDGTARDIAAHMPQGFSMLLIAVKGEQWLVKGENIFTLDLPASRSAITAAVAMIAQFGKMRNRPREKTAGEHDLLIRAKRKLMERYFISEEEAHRLIQKKSMDTGRKLTDCALEIIKGEP